jgi:hypothetical protein
MEFILLGLVIVGAIMFWKRSSRPATSEYYQEETKS